MCNRWSDYLERHPDLFRQHSVVGMFRMSLHHDPDKIALHTVTRTYTYEELEFKSNQIAWALKKQGIKPGSIVAVNSGRSAASIGAILGIWKAGCAYVYFDENSPAEYNDFIRTQCSTAFDVTNEFVQRAIMEESGEFFPEEGEPHRLAVIIYTSGTTGHPKGVMLTHRSLTASASNGHILGINSDDNFSCFASLMFIASVNDICTSFCVGCTLCLIPNEIRPHIQQLASYFKRFNITIAFLPPHMAQKYMDMPQADSMRLLLVGSEPARNLKKQHYRIVNIYASSEGSSIITHYDIQDERHEYPIGVPMPTYRYYIVGEDGQQVPKGESGELWISGPQLFEGYANRPDLNAEKLIPNPFPHDPAFYRVFKTADIVSESEEGLVYHGRVDNMVKVRGFRIELTGIEKHMLEFPGIKEACCTVFKDDGGTNILFGYYISSVPIDHELFRDFLAKAMPYYQVPSCLIACEEFPRTGSGKVARKKFVAPPELNNRSVLLKKYY